ncbi:hypothetical protein ROA7450_00636 [Roseovarius albus]|uniref:YjiS-like domain-containing protein n=1 Tax=Roseovarius albus TaxID=1247867 RepID=A0A1X6YFX8_9RHOB|nr:DUF1127 domain-containing protein [Roseovarius albus]SLN19663.1 hypothetical protein ROA7450_00636 [Roseovarius albus]
MAYTTTNPTTGFAGVFEGVSKLFSVIADWNRARATRAALSELSDRELEDIGICRGDINEIAARH